MKLIENAGFKEVKVIEETYLPAESSALSVKTSAGKPPN
jgi:hypothetical protein